MTNPTVAERIDPKSPHYDAAFAELHRKAYKAAADHEADMKSDPDYRAAFEKKYGRKLK